MGDFAIVTGKVYADKNGFAACEIFETLIDEDVEHDGFDGIDEFSILEYIDHPVDLKYDFFFTVLIKARFVQEAIYSWDHIPEPDVEYDVRQINSPRDFLKHYAELA